MNNDNRGCAIIIAAIISAIVGPLVVYAGVRRFQNLNHPDCSCQIAKSGGPGLDLAIQAERSGAIVFLETP